MSIEVIEREVEGIVILDLRGRLLIGPGASLLKDTIERLLLAARTRVILNLQHVPSMDSTALGVLVAAHSSFEERSGALTLLHVRERNLELLLLTKLSTIFRLFDDERLAIDSFFPDRQPRTFDILEFVQSQDEDADKSPGPHEKSK